MKKFNIFLVLSLLISSILVLPSFASAPFADSGEGWYVSARYLFNGSETPVYLYHDEAKGSYSEDHFLTSGPVIIVKAENTTGYNLDHVVLYYLSTFSPVSCYYQDLSNGSITNYSRSPDNLGETFEAAGFTWYLATKLLITTASYNVETESISSISYSGAYNDTQAVFNAIVEETGLTNDESVLPPSSVGRTAHFSVPAGNVAVVEFAGSGVDYDLSLVQSFPDFQSFAIGSTSARIIFSDSLPTGNISGHFIRYIKQTPLNIFGGSKTGRSTKSYLVSLDLLTPKTGGKYLIISNPLYSSDNLLNPKENGTMVIDVENAISVRVYPLNVVMEKTDNGYVNGNTVDDEGALSGTIADDGSVSYVDSDGNSAVPSFGGNSDVSDGSLFDRLKNLLDGVVSSITSMFTSTHDAITRLVSLGSNFVSRLGSLYSWLPSDVYSALTAGIILVITIGVLKVFL